MHKSLTQVYESATCSTALQAYRTCPKRPRGLGLPRPRVSLARRISRVLFHAGLHPHGRGHFSWAAIARDLQQPTRVDTGRAAREDRSRDLRDAAWPCTWWGLACHSGHPERGGLLPHHFTLACAALMTHAKRGFTQCSHRRCHFCATVPRVERRLSPPTSRVAVSHHHAQSCSDFPHAPLSNLAIAQRRTRPRRRDGGLYRLFPQGFGWFGSRSASAGSRRGCPQQDRSRLPS